MSAVAPQVPLVAPEAPEASVQHAAVAMARARAEAEAAEAEAESTPQGDSCDF